jgi:hypothetical protein
MPTNTREVGGREGCHPTYGIVQRQIFAGPQGQHFCKMPVEGGDKTFPYTDISPSVGAARTPVIAPPYHPAQWAIRPMM